jgi:ankyrin repeat protein
VGAWRRRGATSLHMRMALGLAVGDFPSEQWLATDSEGRTIWHYWAASPAPRVLDDKIFNLMPEKMRDVLSKNGEHPLHRLTLHGQGRALQQWTERYPVTEAPAPLIDGTTLFHAAAWSGDADTLKWVCRHGDGSEVSSQDKDGLTPLTIAIHRFEPDEIKPLILAGAEPNSRDAQKRTCLHHAAQHGLVDFMVFLEDIGGDSSLVDETGCSVKQALRDRLRMDHKKTELTLRQNWEKRANGRIRF